MKVNLALCFQAHINRRKMGLMKSNKKLSKVQFKTVFKNFCDSTTLHGYSYLNSDKSTFVQILWIFVIITMTGLGMNFLLINTQKFLEMKISTSIETSTEALKVNNFVHTVYFF